MYGYGPVVPEFTHISVLTESGTEYILRFHGRRMYVTRKGEVNPFLPPEAQGVESYLNRVSDTAIDVVLGEPMDILFRDADWLGVIGVRSTPVVAYHEVDYVGDRIFERTAEVGEY